LFDASVDRLPHFVYTDHTALASRQYESPGAADAEPPWLDRERRIYERAAVVFTMSRHVSRSLTQDYGIDPDKVQCVFAGGNVDPPHGTEADYASGRILFVGRDWERKGGPDLLAAFAEVRTRHPGATLRIVGCRPEISGQDGVTVLGERSPEQVRDELTRAAVFCLPTRREPFGLVFVEALSLGVPVVATAIGAVPDIVGDGESGFLRAPGDTRGLTDALSALLADPALCRRFGQAGQAHVSRRYTWSSAVGAISERIRAVIERERSLS
jgi:glycosyltransferase involved in cell wall biosynthesis